MRGDELLKEARRIMTICNACRYCEGFCAVFPAMELRRVFSDGELKYLANLCHNCRSCYYACQYAPPHEFMLNVPRTMSQLRRETYREFAFPRVLSRLFVRNGLAVGLITGGSVLLIVGLILLLSPLGIVMETHIEQGAFYKIVPYELMVIPPLTLTGIVAVFLFVSLDSFWAGTDGPRGGLMNLSAHLRALKEVLTLTYLGGGGHGCNYPDERFSHIRRWLHQSVFYGLLLAGAATGAAAFYDHVLNEPGPHSIMSLPVVLGTVGGISAILGSAGLLFLKRTMDKAPWDEGSAGMDRAFTWLILLTNASGLILLALRETPVMGLFLAAHLGFVGAFFVSAPFSKFVHGMYRYGALVRHALEMRGEEESPSGY